MSRRRKKRNGTPASSRQVDQRAADWFAHVNGYRDARDMHHKHKVLELKWRTGWRRALDKWRTKYRPAYRRYTTPVKLRRKDRGLVGLVHSVVWELVEDYPHYLTFTFWDDLKKKGIDVPIFLPLLWWELRRDPSEVLRTIADYIDAYKSGRGRLQASEKLYDYAEQVMSRCAKELNWREIRERYCPDYPPDGDGTYRNFQKFLRKRGIPFQQVGEFRGRPRKCVRKQKKDTQLPLN